MVQIRTFKGNRPIFDALRKDVRIWMELSKDASDMVERIGELSRMRLEQDMKEEDWGMKSFIYRKSGN